MNGEKRYFLDTNALVAFGNGDKSIGDLLADADGVFTSVVCELEYLSWEGLTEEDERHFKLFLSMINVIDVSSPDMVLKSRVVEIRRMNKKIKLPDAIVMASAAVTRSVLLTRDRQLVNAGICEAREF